MLYYYCLKESTNITHLLAHKAYGDDFKKINQKKENNFFQK